VVHKEVLSKKRGKWATECVDGRKKEGYFEGKGGGEKEEDRKRRSKTKGVRH